MHCTVYKETSGSKSSSRKPSQVTPTCERLLPDIENIFNEEKDIRKTGCQMRTEEEVKVHLQLRRIHHINSYRLFCYLWIFFH